MSREDAVSFGAVRTDLTFPLTRWVEFAHVSSAGGGEQTLQEMVRRSIFHHVTFSEPFQDEPHLYRFYQAHVPSPNTPS